MKTKIKLGAVTLILLLLTGCAQNFNTLLSTPNTPNTNNTMPIWILNPIQSNAESYYAVGEGNSQNEAKISALNQIASEISVSVSSDLSVSKISTQGNYSKDVELNVKSSVEKIEFTSAQIEKSHFYNGKFYSLVSVNKEILYNKKKSELDNNMSKIDVDWRLIQNQGVFALITKHESVDKSISDSLILTSLIKTINTSFNEKKYTDKLFYISEKMQNMKSNISACIQSNNASAYAEVLKKSLSLNGIKIVPVQQLTANMIKIDVSKSSKEKFVKTTDNRLKNAKFADVKLTLKTYNNKNKVVAQNIVTVTNISNISYQDAVDKTSRFSDILDDFGLMYVLTGKE
jgi:hypothetical protein